MAFANANPLSASFSPSTVQFPEHGLASSNPFATRFTQPGRLPYVFADHVDPRIADDDSVRRIVSDLIRHRRGLIVGPHGTGKTTLLHSLMPCLNEAFSSIQRVHLTRGESMRWIHRWRHSRDIGCRLRECKQRAKSRELLLLDGAEQVMPWQLMSLLRWSRAREVTLLATSHRPLRGIPVLYRTCLDASLINVLTHRLVRSTSAEIQSLVAAQLERRQLDAVSNLRELWFELYDVVQPVLLSSLSHPSQRTVSIDAHGMSGN